MITREHPVILVLPKSFFRGLNILCSAFYLSWLGLFLFLNYCEGECFHRVFLSVAVIVIQKG